MLMSRRRRAMERDARQSLGRVLRSLFQLMLVAAALLAFASAAFAQSVPPPLTQYTIDANGVDVVNGGFHGPSHSVAIGQPGASGLVYTRTYDATVGVTAWRDNVTGTINSSGSIYTVTLMGASETFTLSGGIYTSNEGRGGTLIFDSGTQVYTYRTASGVLASYSKSL